MSRLPVRHMEVSYDDTGRVDRLILKLLADDYNDYAYVVAIEPNDGLNHPTEISVKRRHWVGPHLADVDEELLTDRDRAFKTEAEAWAEVEHVIASDLEALK